MVMLPRRVSLIILAAAAALLMGQAKPPRSAEVLNAQLQDADSDLAAIGSQDDLIRKDKRTELGPQAVPLLKKQNQLIDELARASPADAPSQYFRQLRNMATLATLGDEEAGKRLDALAKSGTPKEAAAAKIGQTLRDWYNTSGDAESQKKLVDSLTAMVKLNPRDDMLTSAAFEMKSHGAASPELADTLDELIRTECKSDAALAYRLVPKIGQPMTVAGAQLSAAGAGPGFSSAMLRGKVILVYVWRMSDRNARQRLGPLTKLLADRHDKGLELVGVASAGNLKDLAVYLQERGVSFPQVVDGKNPASNHLISEWQIDRLPRQYIIDRAGILRAINPADEQLGEQLDQLLDTRTPAATQAKK